MLAIKEKDAITRRAEPQHKLLEDIDGNKSSKRFWGACLLMVGIIFSIILFGFSVLKPIGDSRTALSIIDVFLIAGSSLLGLGIFEQFRKRH